MTPPVKAAWDYATRLKCSNGDDHVIEPFWLDEDDHDGSNRGFSCETCETTGTPEPVVTIYRWEIFGVSSPFGSFDILGAPFAFMRWGRRGYFDIELPHRYAESQTGGFVNYTLSLR